MIWKILGSLFLIRYGIKLLQFEWVMLKLYILPLFGIKVDLKKYGTWAVVTGATDGIGKSVALQLARNGLNIVLISRTKEKLEKVAEEIKALNVESKIIAFDFSNNDGYQTVREQLKNLDIGILINNVGIGYDHPDYYLSYDQEVFRKMLNLNVTSLLEMTRIVMEGMVERKKGGLLVHMSSGSANTPGPFLTVYAAAKTFVISFSKSLSYECQSHGIKNHVITPYFVATKMSKMRPSGFRVPTPDLYAKYMVNSLGLTDKSCGYWGHEIIYYITSSLPERVFVGHLMKMFLATRKKWLKKQNKKEE